MFENLAVPALRKLCRDNGLSGYSIMNRDELIRLLTDAQVTENSTSQSPAPSPIPRQVTVSKPITLKPPSVPRQVTVASPSKQITLKQPPTLAPAIAPSPTPRPVPYPQQKVVTIASKIDPKSSSSTDHRDTVSKVTYLSDLVHPSLMQEEYLPEGANFEEWCEQFVKYRLIAGRVVQPQVTTLELEKLVSEVYTLPIDLIIISWFEISNYFYSKVYQRMLREFGVERVPEIKQYCQETYLNNKSTANKELAVLQGFLDMFPSTYTHDPALLSLVSYLASSKDNRRFLEMYPRIAIT